MNMKTTLYISDLDGTLLNHRSALSPYTTRTLSSFMARGLCFAYATARSPLTAAKVTAALSGVFPVITYNGTFISCHPTGERLSAVFFTAEEARHILDTLLAYGIHPTVFADLNGRERMSYCPALLSDGMRAFRATRPNDPRARLLQDPAALYEGQIFYVSCIDRPDKLAPAYEALTQAYRCLYYTDPDNGAQWLEITPQGATKAQAALALQRRLGCDRLVCFGDGINDLPLFEVADEGYAVANAHRQLKAIATAVIGSNDEDGVARWLAEHLG